jgi:hypothetical protein
MRFGLTRKTRLALYALGAFFILYAVLGFLVAPPIVRSQLERRLSTLLNRPVSVERVRINPFALSMRIDTLAVKERDQAADAAGFHQLFVDLSYTSIVRFAPVVSAVTLMGPYLRIVRHEDRTYNFQDVIDALVAPQPAAPAEPPPPPRFAVFNIAVAGGRLDFDDRPERLQHAVTDLRIGIPFVSSLPSQVDITVKPELSAQVDGAPLALTGDTKPFKDTRETVIRLDLDDLSLPKYLDYVPVPLRWRLPSGRLDTRLALSFATLDDKLQKLTLGGSASLRALAVRSLDDAPLAAFDRLDVDLDEIDLLARKATVRRVALSAPSLDVVRTSDGRINLLDLVPPPAPQAAAKPEAAGQEPFAFAIADIAVAGGTVRFTDQVPARPFRIELQKIALGVTGLANTPETTARVTLGLDTAEKARLDCTGGLKLVPLAGDGELKLAGLGLATLMPYVEQALNLDIPAGTLAASARMSFASRGELFDLRLDGLAATVERLALDHRDGGKAERLWQIGTIEVKESSLDLAGRRVTIGSAGVRDAKGQVRRAADGSTVYTQLVKTAPPPEPAPLPAQSGSTGEPQWRVDAGRLAIDNAAVTIDDQAPATPVRTLVTRLGVELREFSSVAGSRARARVQAIVNGAGSITASGTIRPRRPAGSFALTVDALKLPPWQPYLEPFAAVVVTDGALSVKGNVTFDAAEGRPVRAAYRGEAGVADLATLDAPTSQELLKWKSLAVAGIDFELEPLKVSVDEIALSDYYARLIVNADGTLNLQQAIRRGAAQPRAETAAPPAQAPSAQAEAAPPTAPPGARGLPPNVRVGRVRLVDGNVQFSDFLVRPNYSANLTGVGGELTEMTPAQAADLTLRGQLNQRAPLAIDGRLNLLSAELLLDLKASARDIELSPLTPYAAKYAGYGIEKGKLSVTVGYRIEDRKLVAENRLVLDQLTFGERVESPTATRLPVLLAVALLKDRNGVIDLNVPISGSIDDPQFSVGRVILQVIVNLITKAVTAPFALLGSLFGGGAELAWVEFAPGSARLEEAALARLKSLGAALAERPGLKLEITGRADPATDREGLQREAVLRLVRAQKLKETVRGGATGSLEAVRLEAGEYEKYLAAAYREAKFERPRNAIGLLKELPHAEMERLMLANVQAGDEALRELADARGLAAKQWLVGQGKIAPERVFLVAPKLDAAGIADKGTPARADFSLK